jgi:integrase
MLKRGLSQSSSVPIADPVNSSIPTFSEGVLTYLSLKGKNKSEGFKRTTERSCGYVIDVCGDKPLNEYTKSDANKFRDDLIERGLAGSSITRVFGSVRSVFNFATSEEGLSLTNPFAKVYYDRTSGVSDRIPMPEEDIRKVQQKCFELDDELRWLVALVSDTGMRLAEAAGLLRDDIQTDDQGQLMVNITPHPWRRLKTKGSERVIPLVGASEWAARRILERREAGEFAFPRYNRTGSTNANSASAALNKWLKPMVSQGASMHSFRHSMRDRLRAVECPSNIVDQIGGWQTEGVGQGYGNGYQTVVLQKWMNKSNLNMQWGKNAVDERQRVAIKDGYANELGLALYCFALCEWNVVWCAEKLDSGYIHAVEDATKRNEEVKRQGKSPRISSGWSPMFMTTNYEFA